MVNKKLPNGSSKKKITTLKLLEETKKRIDKLKEHKRESYDEILRKILYILNLARENPEKARKALEKIGQHRKKIAEEEKKHKEEKKKEDKEVV